MVHKDNCGFRRSGCCTFKPEFCLPEKCDMYSIPFTSKDIKENMTKIKEQVLELQKDTLNVPKIKEMILKEKEDKNSPEVLDMKKKLALVVDLQKGYEYMNKAYIKAKREGK